MTDRPTFEPLREGICDVLKCVNPAKYRARWPRVSKLVCESHKNDVADKPWPEVAQRLFGGNPPK